MSNKEQRRSPRHRVSFKLVYDDGNSYNSGIVDDVSETGLFLECAVILPVGSIVRLEPVDAMEDALFEVAAKVVRCVTPEQLAESDEGSEGHRGLGGMGLEFIDSGEGRAAVQKMIDQLEKHAAAQGDQLDPYLGKKG